MPEHITPERPAAGSEWTGGGSRVRVRESEHDDYGMIAVEFVNAAGRKRHGTGFVPLYEFGTRLTPDA